MTPGAWHVFFVFFCRVGVPRLRTWRLSRWPMLCDLVSETSGWHEWTANEWLTSKITSDFLLWNLVFSRTRSEGSRFTWGSGGEAVFANSCVCDRNRRQPSASVGNRLREGPKALHSGECLRSGPVASASGVVRKACQVDSLSPQLYWSLQSSDIFVSPQLYWRLQRRCLCELSVSPQLFWRLQRRCLCEGAVAPQLCWCLQRRCLCEGSVAPQLFWRLQRRCQCEWSVSPQLNWCLQRRCLWEWSVSQKGVEKACHVRVSCKSVK